jgi:hypothetical protein
MGYTLVIQYWIFKDSNDIRLSLGGVMPMSVCAVCVGKNTHTHTHTQSIVFLRKSRSLLIATTVPHYFRMIEKRAMQGEHSTTSWP